MRFEWIALGLVAACGGTTAATSNILPGRKVTGWYGGAQDIGGSAASYFAKPMQDPSYFATCLAADAGDAYVNCLENALLACP